MKTRNILALQASDGYHYQNLQGCSKSQNVIRFALVFLIAGILCMPLHATLLVYEGFNGYSSGQLAGQNTSANSVGLTGTVTALGADATVYTYNSTGLTFGNMQVSGGSATYHSNSGIASGLSFAYNGATQTGVTLYSSYLINFNTAQNTPSVASLRANSTLTSTGPTAYFQSVADTTAGTTPGNGYPLGNSVDSASIGTLNTGVTYLVIGAFTNVGVSLSLGTQGIGTTYVLSASQYSWFQENGGFTIAALNAATVGTGDGNVTSRIGSVAISGTYTFASGNAIQASMGNAGVNQTLTFDELHFGTSLGDVVAIPEPSAFWTACIASGLLLMGRTFRSRLT